MESGTSTTCRFELASSRSCRRAIENDFIPLSVQYLVTNQPLLFPRGHIELFSRADRGDVGLTCCLACQRPLSLRLFLCRGILFGSLHTADTVFHHHTWLSLFYIRHYTTRAAKLASVHVFGRGSNVGRFQVCTNFAW